MRRGQVAQHRRPGLPETSSACVIMPSEGRSRSPGQRLSQGDRKAVDPPCRPPRPQPLLRSGRLSLLSPHVRSQEEARVGRGPPPPVPAQPGAAARFAPGLRKCAGALGGREWRLSPLGPGPASALDPKPSSTSAAPPPGAPSLAPRRAPQGAFRGSGALRRAPRPGAPDSPRGTQLHRLAEQPKPDSQASRGAGRWRGGREAEPGRARAGSDFPAKAGVGGGVGGGGGGDTHPCLGSQAPSPGLPVLRVPRGPGRCGGRGAPARGPKGPQVASPTP